MATGFAENSAKTRSPKPDRTSSRLTPDVVRKNSVTHRKARGSIRDAIRRGSDWHGLHMIPRGDGANWPLGSRDTRPADREHPDPALVRKYCAQLKQGTANTREAAPRAPICYALSCSWRILRVSPVRFA